MRFYINPHGEFSPTELRFLKVMQDKKPFEDLVFKIRKKAGLPKGGITVKSIDQNGKITFEKKIRSPLTSENYLLISKATKLLLQLYKLPESWFYPFTTIIVFNAAIEPSRASDNYTKIDFTFIGGTEKILDRIDRPLEPDKYVKIIIKENLNFKLLIKILEENKEKIEPLLQRLSQVPLVKTKNIEIFQRIKELSQNYSDSKIGKTLKEEFKNELTFETDRKTINTYKQRYETDIEMLPQNKFALVELELLLK